MNPNHPNDEATLRNTAQNRFIPIAEENQDAQDARVRQSNSKTVKFAEEKPKKSSMAPPPVPQPQAQNQPQAQPTAQRLQQLSYHCPGIHGPGCRQDIRRMSFGELLTLEQPLYIPLLQRRYCWGNGLAKTWWRDTARGGNHSVGKAIFILEEDEQIDAVEEDDHMEIDGDDAPSLQPQRETFEYFHIVDGQQRVTTTLLLLAAARDTTIYLLSRNESEPCENGTKLLQYLHERLFYSEDNLHTWMTQNEERVLREGMIPLVCTHDRLPFCRLTPSHVDRPAFYEILLSNYYRYHLVQKGKANAIPPPGSFSKATLDSSQFVVYSHFMNAMSKLVERQKTVSDKISALHSRIECAMKMQLMWVLPLNEVNMAQHLLPHPYYLPLYCHCFPINLFLMYKVFLWFQEKSLISVGALLHNPTPGIKFTASVLIRNHILSVFMDKTITEQERIMRVLWLEPFASLFVDGYHIDKCLRGYLTSISISHVSAFEEKVKGITKSLPPGMFGDTASLSAYAQFVSVLEHETMACNGDEHKAAYHLFSYLTSYAKQWLEEEKEQPSYLQYRKGQARD